MKKRKPTTRELYNWCDEGGERVLKVVDTALDKLNLDNPETKAILVEASDIIKEIEQLEKELEELLFQ
jgi:heme oxygenase